MVTRISLTTGVAKSSYPILIEQNFDGLAEIIPKNVSQIFVLSDSNVAPLFFDAVAAKLAKPIQLIQIEPGEQHKNLLTIESIWQQLNDADADRAVLILNLGGGVVTDLGGFAAATYKRGIRFINLPTTLLAQVDAAIGGKTGINFAGLKNNIGTFTQPIGVYCNTVTLSTLTDQIFAEGFGEIIKHAIISENTILHELEENPFNKNDAEQLARLVIKSIQVKVNVVSQDERETNLRKTLNFGHTFGHALESQSHKNNTPLLHGEAVGLGMLAELHAANKPEILKIVQELLVKFNLPVKLDFKIDLDDFLATLVGDKKNHSGYIQWVVPSKLGTVEIDKKLTEQQVKSALSWLQD
ncbi:3-dehydroquinate synthase [Candidatus Saccharibacteria bacterium]|nr:3-dehydroquinate synthase [Candidatus Saccharibacteria bacterium]